MERIIITVEDKQQIETILAALRMAEQEQRIDFPFNTKTEAVPDPAWSADLDVIEFEEPAACETCGKFKNAFHSHNAEGKTGDIYPDDTICIDCRNRDFEWDHRSETWLRK